MLAYPGTIHVLGPGYVNNILNNHFPYNVHKPQCTCKLNKSVLSTLSECLTTHDAWCNAHTYTYTYIHVHCSTVSMCTCWDRVMLRL